MKLTITIQCDNEAFEQDLANEVKECLEQVCLGVALGKRMRGIFDSNGNRVGEYELEQGD